MCVFFIRNLAHEGKYQGTYFCFQIVMMAEIIVQTALLYITTKKPQQKAELNKKCEVE